MFRAIHYVQSYSLFLLHAYKYASVLVAIFPSQFSFLFRHDPAGFDTSFQYDLSPPESARLAEQLGET
ncbi:hypothetical protein RRG08_050583 [Elysia crispata]|uniref:Uncharacterized protein n=1 Tax=Elysia crispata TaxID=231223 RepID=A0AAE1DB16_9GAST|nr:hypothetical protein RRG08_050583 [Elysia crispata]